MGLLENHTVYTDNVHSPQLLAYNGGMSSHILTATVICLLFQRLWTQRLNCLFEMVQRSLIFFFLHLLSMNSSEASPAVSASSHTTHAPLRAGFQLNPGIFPSVFLSWSFFTHSKHYLSSLSVLCTQLVCYSSRQDFSPACWHQCQQHAEWLRRPSSFGNGAVLLGQYPFSYCLKTRPSWRLS